MPLPLALQLFGPFQTRYNDHLLDGFATDKVRALLAYLALESGKPHRREALATLLWPDYSDETALRNLRQALYRLRQTLQEADSALPDQLLIQTRQTLALNPSALTLDTAQFTHLLQQAKTASEPITCLTQAVDLYQGELLKGFSIPDAYAFDEWLTIQREIYHQQALEAFARLLASYEMRDAPDTILTLAPRLLALEPWHEETHRQLMRVHLRLGNRAQAVAQYHQLKTTLTHELGIEPAPATTALFEQIQAHIAPAQTGPPIPRPAPVHHLPAPLTPLIGRKPELDYLTQTLQDPACRLLTLTGPGGMGKTRLAVETARRLAAQPNRFTGGIFFIPLAQISQGHLLLSTLAQHLNLSFPHHVDLRQEIVRHLENQSILLIFDNFEHLLDATGDEPLSPALVTLTDLLSSASGVTVLITSREPLALHGEWTVSLDGLPYIAEASQPHEALAHPAPQLFIQSARRYRPSFDPPTHSQAILDICRLTDGMPLALEMAAAWMRAYECPEIARRIAQSLDFLTSPFRDAPARQRSIRAIFTSAWEQLTAEQQSSLAAMSVFRGGFTVQAALTVAQASVLDLATLVEKTFLRHMGGGRYDIHELVRQFAAEKLEEMGETEGVQARHADFYLAVLDEQGPELYGAAPHDALQTLRTEVDNMRLAWAWLMTGSDHPRAVRAAASLEEFYRLAGLLREAEAVFRQAVQWAEQTGAPASALTTFLIHLAMVLSYEGRTELAEPFARQALSLAEQEGLDLLVGKAYSILGALLHVNGAYPQAIAHRKRAANIFEAAGEVRLQAFALNGMAHDHWQMGDYATSGKLYQQALVMFTTFGDRFGAAQTAGSLGLVHLKQGEFAPALAYFQQELDTAREMDNPMITAKALNNMAVAYHEQGKPAEALILFEEAAAIDRRLGVKLGLAKRLTNIGLMYWKLGNYTKALSTEQEALRLLEELNYPEGVAINLGNIGLVYWHQGAYEAALATIQQAFDVDEARGNKEGIARHLSNLGAIHRDLGQLAEALSHLQRACAIQEEANLRYPLTETYLRLAEVYLTNGALAEAETTRQKGQRIAQAMQRRDAIFWAKELEARLSAAQGDTNKAIAQFQKLLEEADQEEQEARVVFEHWRLTKTAALRKDALRRYQALFARIPNVEFRRRIEELQTS